MDLLAAGVRMGRTGWSRLALLVALGAAAAACGGNPALQDLIEARRLSTELLAQFEQLDEAGTGAVMADTDDRSAKFVLQVHAATKAADQSAAALAPLLESLRLTDEQELLAQFNQHFAEYKQLDKQILDLDAQNSNVKAQQLSFDDAADAADDFRDALGKVTAAAEGPDAWQERALAATALADAREIQVIQAPHIAAFDDPAMIGLEKRMSAAESATRSALADLGRLIPPASKAGLDAATAAFDRLMQVNAQIISLSRLNTNLRSIALSLNEKGVLTAKCEHALRALEDALAKHAVVGTR